MATIAPESTTGINPDAVDIVASLRNTAAAEHRISISELELVDELLTALRAGH